MALIDSLYGFDGRQDSGLGQFARKMRGLFGFSRGHADLDDHDMNVISLVDQAAQREQANFSLIDGQTLGDWDINMVAYPSGGFRNHFDWMSSVARGVKVHETPAVAFNKMARAKPYSSIAVVDIDVFDDFGDAVDALREFRMRAPMVPTVIGSRRFKYNDFSTSRFPIADASIKLPVSRVGLGLALNAALGNHQHVLEREVSRARH
ncbi:hypothetical protein [Nioella nitratireducens]|uniref:hypothetical protein n=1 Tax=Nioella nitratireducens TaxID=1287720 RepID=UPI0008FCF196|nr:hypothetical protein [Nioella nitratireducens]